MLRKKGMLRRSIFSAAILAALLLATGPRAKAQDVLADNAWSPYSLFGFGDLVREGSSYNLSMGGTGIGDRNVRYINTLNPAAVTAREQKSFMMDFGIENRNTLYRSGDAKSGNNVFNMHHIVASFPIYTHSAFKVGFRPYSTVGYKFQSSEQSDALVSEMGDVRYTQQGKGGIYQAFLGAGVTLWKRLSLGADLDYYFGKIDRYSQSSFPTSASYRYFNTGWAYNVSCFGGRFGLQYEQPFGGGVSAIVGVTYDLPTKLRGGESRYAIAETASSADTISMRKGSLERYYKPGELGAGLTVHSDTWSVSLDYKRADWTGIDFGGYPGVDFTTGVAQSFRAGFELTPGRYDVRSGFGHFLRRMSWRGGVYHERSHLWLGGNQVTATGVTLGFGIPVFRYYNSVNVGLDFGQRGSVVPGPVRERYFLVNVSFNLHDIWFIKLMYN